MSADTSPFVVFLRRFGRRLRLLRVAADLTQAQLGDAAGMSRAFIVTLERGRTGMDVDRLHDLADALAVTVRDLIPKDDP
jgi:transcriptional regulator with XRE-family HTH domain